MKRLLFAIVAASAGGSMGCFMHTHFEKNASGHVDLEKPPRAPTSKIPETPSDPGERGIVVGATATVGGGSSGLDAGKKGVFAPGFEVSFMPFSLDKSHAGTIVQETLDRSLRANVGWNYVRTWGPSDDTHTRVGPMFVEAQLTTLEQPDRFWGASIALGAAMEFRQKVPLGPQATGCFGIPLLMDGCARLTWIPREGSELIFMIGYHGFAEWVWSK